jgi:hypothetical protein
MTWMVKVRIVLNILMFYLPSQSGRQKFEAKRAYRFVPSLPDKHEIKLILDCNTIHKEGLLKE